MDDNELWTFSWRTPIVLASVLAVYLLALAFITGCTAVQPGQEIVFWHDCDGRRHATELEVRVGFPALDCLAAAVASGDGWSVAEMIVGFPALACVLMGDPYPQEPLFHRAVMYLPPYAPDALIAHERAHMTGYQHPRLLPLLMTRSCE